MTGSHSQSTTPGQSAAGGLPDLNQVLRSYFEGYSVDVVTNPAQRLTEGFLVHVTTQMWGGRVRLLPEDLGLPATAYQELAKALSWGSLSLLDDETKSKLSSLATQARKLPIHWGRRTTWGRFIPLSAMPKFKEAFEKLQTEWRQAIADWVNQYDVRYAVAEQRALLLAQRAQEVADQLEADIVIDPNVMVDRLLSKYPTVEEVQDEALFGVRYDVTFIPSPQLTAAQAAQLEVLELEKQQKLAQLRREAEQREYEHDLARARALNDISMEEAKQQEKVRVVQEEKERLQRELETERKKLLNEFYQGYALDIRQRLHEALMFVTEGVRKGKMAPGAGRSLRTVLDEIQYLALDDDQEIRQMRERLQALLGEPGKGGKGKAEEIKQGIEDMGVLLQTSILAMGEAPRMPRRGGEEIVPQDVLAELPPDADAFQESVRQARRRVGLDSSLAEVLVDGIGPDELRRRRQRGFDEVPLLDQPGRPSAAGKRGPKKKQ